MDDAEIALFMFGVDDVWFNICGECTIPPPTCFMGVVAPHGPPPIPGIGVGAAPAPDGDTLPPNRLCRWGKVSRRAFLNSSKLLTSFCNS